MHRKTPSVTEPVTEVGRIKIVECGEPLVPFLELCPKLWLDRPRFRYQRVPMLRRTAAEMLCRAACSLPSGYTLGVVEGYRPPHIQRRMYMAVWRLFAEKHPDWSETKLKRTVNRFTAPIHGKVPPPHSTGGAVDVVLGNEEKLPLDVTSPYKRDDPHGFLTAAQGLSEEAAKNRTLLCRTMHEAGLTNYPSEYWHYSYGDQGWAYRGGHPHAVYGPTAPKGWLPPEEELTDEPLEWADVP